VGVDVDRVADGGEGLLCGHQFRLERRRDSLGLDLALRSSVVKGLLRIVAAITALCSVKAYGM
jgi:hypothetical protein